MIVTTADELNALCQRLLLSTHIAIDTEFVRKGSYHAKLCLIQVAGNDTAFIIDVLSGIPLTPLIPILANDSILKVLHGAIQDLEVLYAHAQIILHNIVDTQIASAVLGYSLAISYENLAKQYLQIKLDKRLQFSNWDARPLTARYINYALADALCLNEIWPMMLEELSESGKLYIAKEESNTLITNIGAYMTPEKQLIKFCHIFPQQMPLLKCLLVLRWREKYARMLNFPRNKILTDSDVIQVVQSYLSSGKKSSISAVVNRYIDDLYDALMMYNAEDIAQIDEALRCYNMYKQFRYSNGKTLVAQLKALLVDVSLAHNIVPNLIASSSDLVKFACGLKSRIDSGWRYQLFGEQAIQLKAKA